MPKSPIDKQSFYRPADPPATYHVEISLTTFRGQISPVIRFYYGSELVKTIHAGEQVTIHEPGCRSIVCPLSIRSACDLAAEYLIDNLSKYRAAVSQSK